MANMEQHKRQTFLHGMVAADIFKFRNVERDSKAVALANQLREQAGRDDGAFYVFYAQRMIYTDALHFSWHPEAPLEFKNLEKWWNMVQSGESELECYLFYVGNISNPVSNEWQTAVEAAHTIWKPPQETNKESDDPNS